MAEDFILSKEGLDMSNFITIDESPEKQEEEKQELPKEEIKTDLIEDKTDDQSNKDKLIDEEIQESVDEEDEEEQPDDKKDESSSQSIYSSLSSILKEQGVLPSLSDDQKIESIDDLVEALSGEIKKNEYADLNEKQVEYLKALRAGIPEVQVQQHQQTEKQLDSITDEVISENADLRKQLIAQSFLLKGFSQEEATKFAERSATIGEDEADAKDALVKLKAYQKAMFDKAVADREKANNEAKELTKKQQAEFKEAVLATKEVIPGMKITTAQAEQIYDQATKVVGTTKDGRPLNALAKARMDDPTGFEIKLNYLFKLTKGFTDFSKLVKTQKSKAVEELERKLKAESVKDLVKTDNKDTNFDVVLKNLVNY